MFTARNKGRLAIGAVVVGAALALSGCAQAIRSTRAQDDGRRDETIVIGSQAYYSNEIIAEIYAQALENAGFAVEREFQIGQRDAYLPALESGEVDLFPEYTGNLLQFYDPDTTATTSDDVYAALQDALPDGLAVLDQSSGHRPGLLQRDRGVRRGRTASEPRRPRGRRRPAHPRRQRPSSRSARTARAGCSRSTA